MVSHQIDVLLKSEPSRTPDSHWYKYTMSSLCFSSLPPSPGIHLPVTISWTYNSCNTPGQRHIMLQLLTVPPTALPTEDAPLIITLLAHALARGDYGNEIFFNKHTVTIIILQFLMFNLKS